MYNKEEQITWLSDKIKLSTFKPGPGETICLTIEPEKYDLDLCVKWVELIAKSFPENNCILKLDGITLESLMEDDLK